MPLIADMVRALSAAGASAEAIAAALEVWERDQAAKDEARREKKRANNAERQRRWRTRHLPDVTQNNALCDVTARDPALNDGSTLTSTVENNLNPPKESTPKGVPKKVPNRWPEGTINRIWEAYPHKVGKKAAIAKLQLLERSGEVTPEEILDGIANYRRSKPEHHDWKNPSTWLNQGCWSDEYGPPAATGPPQPGQQSFRVVSGTNGAPHVNGKRVSPYRGSLAEAARDSLNEALVRSNEGEGIHPDISRRLSFIGRG